MTTYSYKLVDMYNLQLPYYGWSTIGLCEIYIKLIWLVVLTILKILVNGKDDPIYGN
jgi:hypothetical protein